MADSKTLGDITTDKSLYIKLTNVKTEDGGTGPRNVDFRADDITEDIKVRLGDHLNKITKESNNDSVIVAGSTEVSYRMADGTPAPVTTGDNSTEDGGYTHRLSQSPQGDRGVVEFNDISNSHLFDFDIKKGKSNDENYEDADELYQEINTIGGQARIPQNIERVQEENNRFSQGSPYIDQNITATEDTVGTRDFLPQQSFGRHTPDKFPNASGNSPEPVTIQNLHNLGLQILLEGSGEAYFSKNPDDAKQISAALVTTKLAPGLARIGQRVPYGRFSAGNIMEQVNPDYRKPKISDLENDGPEKLSYGSPWNPLVPFNAVNSESSRVCMALLTLTVSGLLKALSELLQNDNARADFKLNEETDNWAESSKDPWMGSYYGTAKSEGNRFTFNDGKRLISVVTENDYTDCISKGMQTFFNLSENAGAAAIGQAFGNSFEGFGTGESEYGFYVTFLRTLLRDATDILVDGVTGPFTEAFVDYRSRGSLEVNASLNSIDNPLGTVDSIINIIDRIKESRLLKFMNILANLGDLALIANGNEGSNSTIDAIVSEMDIENNYLGINQSILQRKNRLTGKGNLAWGSNTVLSMYLRPTGLLKAEKRIAGTEGLISNLGEDRGFRSAESNRFPTIEANKLESKLDSVYVPFYLHDLRTNEIISFHAFLENVSDSFAVEFEESDGFGRVDSVMSYKSTKRSLGLSFYVVSTNSDDFNQMWFKINKLISMVYPQYTKGRQLTANNGDKFTQPFSQVVGASPLVRLRVGDLIKSNYSELDLARLFGASSDEGFDFSQDTRDAATDATDERARQDTINTNAAGLRRDFAEGNWTKGDIIENKDALFKVGRRTAPQQLGSTSGRGRGNQTIPADTTFEVLLEGEGERQFRRLDAGATDYNEGTNYGSGHGRDGYNIYTHHTAVTKTYTLRQTETPHQEFIITIGNREGRRRVPKSKFKLNDDYARRKATPTDSEDSPISGSITNPVRSDSEARELANVQKFFKSGGGGNPVVRAFNSTKGKGLAGYIRSLKFDWADATWTTTDGSKAPKMMKIDLDFAPIHDISPGLADDGFMIGAPYNIGDMMNQLKAIRFSANSTSPSTEAQDIERSNPSEGES